jgi:hypothetical protein
MDAIVALVVILVIIAIGYFAYSAGKKTCKNGGGGSGGGCPPPPLSPTNFGSWYSADWGKANTPYASTNLPYDQCRAGCEADPKCKTMTGYRTYASSPSRPCAYYDTVIPPASLTDPQGSWEGSVSYRTA